MRKLLFIISTILVITSCATTKESGLSRTGLRQERKLVKQETVKKAIESKRYIIKLEKLYASYGGFIQLMPRANYIIIDGNKAIISAAYLGRQYDIKPIAAINMYGRTKNYEITNIEAKGRYEIKIEVDNGYNSFNVYLSISKDGYCSASINTLRIDNVNYVGHLVPIKDKPKVPSGESQMI